MSIDIVFFDSDKRLEYEELVTSAHGSFLQSWDWGEWQESLGRHVVRVGIFVDNAPLLLCQAIELPLPKGNSYIYAPYGPLLFEQEVKVEHTHKLIDAVHSAFPNSLHFKIETLSPLLHTVLFNTADFSPDKGTAYALSVHTNRMQAGTTLLMDLRKTEAELLAGMHNKTRYNIKVAQKHGLTVHSDNNPAAVKLLYDTGDRQQFSTHEAGYYEKMLEFFKENRNIKASLIYTASKNEPTAVGLYIDFLGTRTYLFGGSDYEKRSLMGPYLLHWEAMKQAKMTGSHLYDFWGLTNLAGKEVGFTKFKLGFGGTSVTYPPALDIIFSSWKYRAFKTLRYIRHKLK